MRKLISAAAVVGGLVGSVGVIGAAGSPVQAAGTHDCDYTNLVCVAVGDTKSECSGHLSNAINEVHSYGFVVEQTNGCTLNLSTGNYHGSIWFRRVA